MQAERTETVIRGGYVVGENTSGIADVAIRDGRIANVGQDLPVGAEEIDARGKYVLPGGVDSHCHIEQISGAGLMNADTFETATRSAAFGGTTSVVSFAAQHPGQRMRDVVRDYSALADKGALIDYAFHMITSDTSGDNLSRDIPELIAQGHRSIKLFTTYDKVRLGDHEILDVLATAKSDGALVCIHAENDGLIRHMTARLLSEGKTAPHYHAQSHPRAAEVEAIDRTCRFAEFMQTPIMIFHVSTREGAEIIRAAKARGVPVSAETCTHYLFMTEAILRQDNPARFLCSPPQRTKDDQAALWEAISDGTLTLLTSDHAPYRMDETGKFAHGADAPFNGIANGMPGLETRLPMMFDAMVSQGKLGVEKFVSLTATTPARSFGLETKGKIAPGFDADIAIWDPDRSMTYQDDDLHDNVGYNPFAGTTVKGYPVTVMSRGEVLVSDGALHGEPGRGQRQPMKDPRVSGA